MMIGPYCAPALKLVVVVDRPGLIRSVEIAFGLVHVGAAKRRAQRLQAQAVGRERGGIRLHPHGRTLPAADAHQAHAFELRNSLRHARFRQLFDLAAAARSSDVMASVRIGASAGFVLL